MAKPSDAEIQALPNDLRLQYLEFADEDESGDSFLQFQLLSDQRTAAQKKAAEDALMLDRIQTPEGRAQVPKMIQDVLDMSETIGGTDAGSKDFSRFMAGFGDFVTTEGTPLTTETQKERPLTPKTAVEDMQAQAVEDAKVYFIGQGYKTELEIQQLSIDDFIEKYGNKQDFVNKTLADPKNNKPIGTLEFEYDQAYNMALNPPGGFPQSAESAADREVLGIVRDREVFGPLNQPIQPRRYAQYGDREPVGPRLDSPIIKSFRNMTPTEAQALTNIAFPPLGASPVAEEFRENPERAANLSPTALAREAFRPQVVRTGTERRAELEEESKVQDIIMGEINALKNQGMSQDDALLAYAQKKEDQAVAALELQGMRENMSADYLRSYRMQDPINAVSTIGLMGDDLKDVILLDMARQNVQQHFRNAGFEAELEGTKFDVDVGSISRYSGLEYNVGKMWQSVTEDPSGNLHVQALKKAGRIDPDAVVETKPMQYARNANMIFRLVINPVMETMESAADTIDYAITGDTTPAMRKGREEVEMARKIGQQSVSPTYDFTADKEYVEKHGYMSAYLAEAMLETATGRTLGHDIVSWHPQIYYTMADDEMNKYKGLQFQPDSYVLAGTLFEMGIPVEAPLQIAALGVKGAAKIPSGIRQANKIGKELGNATTPLQAAAIEGRGGVKGFQDIQASILQNSKVSQHVAEDASDIVLATERVEDMAPTIKKLVDKGDATMDDVLQGITADLSPRGQITARELLKTPDPQKAAREAIEKMAGDAKNSPTLSAAAADSLKARGELTGVKGTPKGRGYNRNTRLEEHFERDFQVAPIDVINERGRKIRLQSAAADSLQGEAGLDDFHMLTDRVAISKNMANRKVRSGDKSMPMHQALVEDVDGHFGGVLKGPSYKDPNLPDAPVGHRVVPVDFFTESTAKGGKSIPQLELMHRGKNVGQMAPGELPTNYKQLLNYQTGEDTLLRGILEDVNKGKPISFQDEMYLRQRAMEQMAYIRSNQMDGGISQRLKRMVPILRNRKGVAIDADAKLTGRQVPSAYGPSTPLQTSEVIQVTPGSTFAQQTAVPRSRRSSIGRTLRAITPVDVRFALKKGAETLKGARNLSAVGEPLDAAMTAVDSRMTEAVTSLERSTPLSASRMRKQGLSDAETLDTMFAMGMNGDDYTRVLGLDQGAIKQVSRQNREALAVRLTDGGNIPSQNPIANNFYSQLLGSAYNDPSTIVALDKAALNLGIADGAQLIKRDVVLQVLDELDTLYKPALNNLAVRGKAVGVRPPDIEGVKIAMAADATRGTRMVRVAQEMGTQLPSETIQRLDMLAAQKGIEPDKYRVLVADHVGELLANGNMPIDEAAAIRILQKNNIRVDGRRGAVGTLDNLSGTPAQRQVNGLSARKGRMIAKGYDDDVIETSILQPAIRELGGDALKLDKAGEIVSKNLQMLRRRDPNAGYNYAVDRLAYVASPKARLVSGQLGGMLAPNGIYHAENFVTAPFIAAVTNPDYIGTVIAQNARFLTGAAIEPSALLKGKSPLQAQKISVASGIVSNEQPITGITRYIGKGGKVGTYTPDEALYHYRNQNLGNTKQSLVLGENFVRDVEYQLKFGAKWNKKGAKEYAGQVAEEVKRQFLPGTGSTYGMKLADDTDRMFREAIFFEALKRGETPEAAGILAREVLLDYGSMPNFMKEGVMQYAMYQSFQYVMAAETVKALAKPKNTRFLVAELNRQRVISESIYGGAEEFEIDGQKIKTYGNQTELLDVILFNEIDKMYDKDAAAYATYYRSPMIGSFKQIVGVMDYFNGVPYSPYFSDAKKKAEGEQQVIQKAGLDAVLESAYMPVLDLVKILAVDPEMEYKKPIPDKVIFQIAAAEQFLGMGKDIYDTFDLEYVPLDERRVGKAEIGGATRMVVDPVTGVAKPYSALSDDFIAAEDLKSGGYQLRFKSAAGYGKFIAYQQLMNFSGYGRLVNDLTGQLITMGIYPEGTTFGYSEKGSPVLYMPGRQKIVRVPPEWEKYDRQIRMQQREIREYLESLD